MNNIKMLKAGGAAVALAVLASSPALATEGYFSHGYGAVNKSMAGAGVALSFDPMSQAINPASLTGVEDGFTADLSVFSPLRSYSADANFGGPPLLAANPGSIDSDRNYFFIPSLAGRYAIDDVSAVGWAIYGNGGMNTTYPAENQNAPWTGGGPFGAGKTGVDLAQGFFQLTYARELTPGVSVGISPIFAAQRFKAFGLEPFIPYSVSPTNVTGNGYDWSYGYGGKIGVAAEFGPGFSFGAAYQTQMYMTDLDKYSGLFADGGEFNIPSSIQVGFGWDSGSGVKVALDYKRINYEDVAAVSNPMLPNFSNGLGGAGGPGFGWESINAYKLGIEVEASPTIKLRAGAALNDNPIPSSEVMFNILAPGVQEQHYTAGMGWQVTSNSTVNIGFMYSPKVSVTGFPPPAAGQSITIEMWQWEGTVGWTWTF